MGEKLGKKKRYRGHYCKVCGRVRSNESFSGKGHKNHICKKCAKRSKHSGRDFWEFNEPVKSPEELDKEKAIEKIERLYRFDDLYDHQWQMLRTYMEDPRQEVRELAESVYNLFSEYYLSEKDMDFDDFDYEEEDFSEEEFSDDDDSLYDFSEDIDVPF